jgi:hypothetical protein
MVRRNTGEVGMEISCHSMYRWFRIADGLLTRYTAFIANIAAIFVSIAGDVWPPGVRAVEAYCRQLGHTPGRIAEWPCLGVKSKAGGRPAHIEAIAKAPSDMSHILTQGCVRVDDRRQWCSHEANDRRCCSQARWLLLCLQAGVACTMCRQRRKHL